MKFTDRILRLFYPSLRRRFLYYFRRDYIENSLARRRGDCQDCGGHCCRRTRLCPYLSEGLCSRYEQGIFRFCKIFPVDPLDIELSGVADVCQYFWEKATDVPVTESSAEASAPEDSKRHIQKRDSLEKTA